MAWRDQLHSLTLARYIAGLYGPHRVNTTTHCVHQQNLSAFYQGMYCNVINWLHCYLSV